MDKKRNFVKDAIALCLITLVAGAGLGVVNELTKGPIEVAKQEAKTAAYKAVFAEAASFTDDAELTEAIGSEQYTTALDASGVVKAAVTEVFVANDASGNKVGFVMSSTAGGGYGGDITISIGIDMAGKVTGIEFLDINETAGLGMNAKEKPEWRTQFYGKEVDLFALGSDLDALSGATITSKAVTNAVNAAKVLANEFGGLK